MRETLVSCLAAQTFAHRRTSSSKLIVTFFMLHENRVDWVFVNLAIKPCDERRAGTDFPRIDDSGLISECAAMPPESSANARAAGQTFPLLGQVDGLRHLFVSRVPGVDVAVEREEALARLAGPHLQALAAAGLDRHAFVTAEQVHGDSVFFLGENDPLPVGPVPSVDALVTRRCDVVLGIYVADCAAVYLIDPVRRVIGLAHSGRKGTELGIVSRTIECMQQFGGSEPQDLLVQISPCIRPPHYEVDFAAEILRQAHTAGVARVEDCGICTASDPERYYSYRREKGRTGRMLALLAWGATENLAA
jgi:copper oxidase (laccase) domain-containing protein